MADLFEVPSRWMDEELVMFDGSVSRFFADKVSPERLQKWREDGIVERAAWGEMAEAGLLDDCLAKYMAGTLDAATASMAKYWTSERAQSIVDRCQQFFGGYGYMNEYPIAQLYKDVRVKRVYGGTTEIMKLLIARTLDS